jgi:glucose/arabinose dehydrogenase
LFKRILFVALLAASGAHGEVAYELETVADGLDFPWGLEFLPDGQMLVTELGGQLRRIGADGVLGDPLDGVPGVYRAGQGGLFDVLAHPDFDRNGLIYLSYAAGGPDANATTVARARLEASGLANLEVIFQVATSKNTPQHYGGRIAWLADGTLLLTTGDGFDFREMAQGIDNQLGKTLRMTDSGAPAPGNPFADAPFVWTYGHRNPQGLVVAADGRVFLHEHGPRGGDEVNVLRAGDNYGWPAITYGRDYNGALISPFTAWEGMEQPIHKWVPSIAPSGLTLYEGDRFPEWRGALFVGALVDREVRRLTLEGTQVVDEEPLFSELARRIRDVRTGPDGYLYIVTDGQGGSVVRVIPKV